MLGTMTDHHLVDEQKVEQPSPLRRLLANIYFRNNLLVYLSGLILVPGNDRAY